MEKLINFYKKLSPPARFRLIFFILASLIVVPLRKDSGVEVYEPYRYDIEDVEENQVVFAHRYTNFSWGKEDYIWIIRKDGTCKRKDLVGNHDIDYQCEELTDEELLDKMDEYMQDETLPEMDKKLTLDKEKINHCINILHTELNRSGTFATDSGGGYIYVVAGTGKDRQLKYMRDEGYPWYSNSDLWVNQVCDEIANICH